MTIRDVVRRLESLDAVLQAGGAAVGGGRLLCFEARVEGADLNDVVQEQVEAAVRQGLHGNVTVSSSKGLTEDSGEVCVFWAFGYTKHGTTTVGGIEYDVLDWDENSGVMALMSDVSGADPSSGLEHFQWGDIEWRPAGWE